MPNNQQHDTRTTNPANRVAQAVGLSVAEVASGAFAAQPGFSVSGTFDQGGEVVISKSGGGFGLKPNGEKAVYVALWEDGHDSRAASALSRDPALTISGGSNTVIQSAVVPEGGANALEYTYQGVTGAGDVQFSYVSTGKELWFAKRRTDFDETDVPANGEKLWRLWSESFGNHNLYFDCLPKITVERTDGNPLTDGFRWSDIKNRWGSEKCRLLQSDLDMQNGKAWWAMDGVLKESQPFYTQRTIDGSGNSSDRVGFYNLFVGPQEQTATLDVPAGKKRYMGMLYFDDSWCHAVFTDSPTFNDASPQEVQPILNWADDLVKIHCRPRNGLNHLHIVDANYSSFYVGAIQS
jgi:hypothetical protein